MQNAVIHKGQEVLLSIKRIGINGEGIGYYKRMAIFVDNALPGEECVVRITKAFEKYAVGSLVMVKGKENKFRTKPLCPYYYQCGGCNMQHISYEGQLQYKEEIVKEAFDKYFNKELNPKMFKPIIGSDETFRYRNKAKLPIRYDNKHLVSGLYASDDNKLVYIEDCLIEKEDIRLCVKKVLDYLTKYQVIAYNPRLKDGVLRHLVVRSSTNTKEIQLTLILYKEDIRTCNIAKDLINIEHVESVYISINDDLDSLENFGKKTYLLVGKESIKETIGDYQFELLPTSFFQLNRNQTKKLYDKVVELSKLSGNEKLIDGFCGVGTIGIYLSKYVKEVRGVDNNKEGIINAENNVSLNHLTNTSFYHGDMEKQITKWHKEGWDADILVIDPPRSGLDVGMIKYLQEHPIKKIIYVSCNPSTLAKNCSHLEKKYQIHSIQPFDMFPNTSNVECIVVLEKK